MALSDDQWKFLQDVAKLIQFAAERGFKLTGGELYRTQEQQNFHKANGRTTVGTSQHMKRLAIDFNIFLPSGALLQKAKDAQVLGDFWESLDPNNRWGGNWTTFVDAPHFERRS